MEWEWDAREQGALQMIYRTHLRAMTTARQAAERRRVLRRGGDAEVRRAAEAAFRDEMAEIDEAHRAWLSEHGLTVGPQRK
jgi:hypothetical protein